MNTNSATSPTSANTFLNFAFSPINKQLAESLFTSETCQAGGTAAGTTISTSHSVLSSSSTTTFEESAFLQHQQNYWSDNNNGAFLDVDFGKLLGTETTSSFGQELKDLFSPLFSPNSSSVNSNATIPTGIPSATFSLEQLLALPSVTNNGGEMTVVQGSTEKKTTKKKSLKVTIPTSENPIKALKVAEETKQVSKDDEEIMDESDEDIAPEERPHSTLSKAELLKRTWRNTFVDPKFAGKMNVEVSCKTRCEKPVPYVEEKLYSSLKYEIRQQVTGSVCSEQQFLLARITVVDGLTRQEILKDNRSIVKGIVESALTKSTKVKDPSNFEGTLKVQFNSVSYHHKKSEFCWQISYFTRDNVDQPIYVMQSAPFLVLARKSCTGKKAKNAKKRNAEEMNEESSTNQQEDEDAVSLKAFMDKLETVVQLAKKLKPNERESALTLVNEKLLQMQD